MKTLMRCVLVGVVAVMMVGAAQAEMKIGVGYQGLLPGDIMNGVSGRAWMGALGADVNLFQASASIEDEDADALILEGRGMLTLFELQQSKFFVGGLLGVGTMEVGNEDVDLWSFGGFFGTEFYLQGLPELGFAWEVGYNFVNAEADDVEMDFNGVIVILGVHYYPEMLNM